ncbi:MAG: hypothetical protein LUQ18_08955 [Methylococcaceae bacterium]|nr:hypothetical protein [Methylococcaceae bacterium]
MTWNYRIIKTPEGFSVYEVFYDEEGKPVSTTVNPTLDFFCDTVEELLEELEIIKAAFDMPAIDINTIVGKESDAIKE